MKPPHGPSTNDIMPGQRKTGRSSPSFYTTFLAAVGIEPEYGAASTDANAAYEAGIPPVTTGITVGSGEHTPGEWIETAPIATGLAALADTIVRYDQEGRMAPCKPV